MTNGLSPSRAGAADWPPGPAQQAARGAPPPSDAFAGILDAQQARTAIAEGQTPSEPERSGTSNSGNERETQGDVVATADAAPTEAPETAGKPEQAVPATQVERSDAAPADAAMDLLAALTVTVPVVQAPAPAPTGNAPAAAAAAVAPVAAVATAPIVEAPVAVAPGASATTSTPAIPGPVQAAAVVPGNAEAPLDPSAPQLPVAPAVKPGATAVPQQGSPPSGQNGQAGQEQPAAQAAPLPRAAVAAAYGRDAQQQQAQAQAPAAQPAATSAPAATVSAPAPVADARSGLPTATPVPLSRAAETVEHVLRLASQRGVTHARIQLHPAELGSIDVRLRSTAQGLVATIVAHDGDAVQTLQQAAGDLRRSLEQQGLNLLNLDIGGSGERSAGRAGADAGGSARGDREGSGDGSESAPADTPTETTLQLPNGVLVDVLA
jgi:flagellar hook-length control protein FliK